MIYLVLGAVVWPSFGTMGFRQTQQRAANFLKKIEPIELTNNISVATFAQGVPLTFLAQVILKFFYSTPCY